MAPVISVTKHTHLADVHTAWAALQQSPQIAQHLFLRYEWFDAALQWQQENTKPYFLLVLKNNLPIGICPMATRWETRYSLTTRILEFLHVPDTQVCDIIADTEHYAIVANAVLAHLAADNSWDELRFTRLHLSDDKQSIFTKACKQHKLEGKWSDESPNPCVHLGKTWTEYYSARSRRLKKGNNLIANKLKKTYESIELDWVHGADIDKNKWDQALQTVVNISGKSWKRNTGLTLDQAGVNAFIRRLSKHAVENNWLSLWLLNLDGNTVAMEYQIIYRGVVHALRADYDEEYSELSPGTYMNWKLLEQLFDADLQRYEMGPGDNAYKQRWAEDHISLSRFTLYNNTLRGRVLRLLAWKIKPWIKSLARLATKSDKDAPTGK